MNSDESFFRKSQKKLKAKSKHSSHESLNRTRQLKLAEANKNVCFKVSKKEERVPKIICHCQTPQFIDAVSITEIKQLRKTEAEMLERIQRLKNRLHHFEKKTNSMNRMNMKRTYNNTCEVVSLCDSAEQTNIEAKVSVPSETKLNVLNQSMEQLNSKLENLTQTLKANQSVAQLHSKGSEEQWHNVELARSIDHLKHRIEKLVQFMDTRLKGRGSYLQLGEYGDGGGQKSLCNPVDVLFSSASGNFMRKKKRLQSVIIVSEPVIVEVSFFNLFHR